VIDPQRRQDGRLARAASDIGEHLLHCGRLDDWGTELQGRMFAACRKATRTRCSTLTAETVLSARTEPIFSIPPVPDQALSTLHQRFRASSSLSTPAAVPSTLPEHVMPLTPGLHLDLEKQNRADYLAARKLIA
jgi:hypothetical protein